MKGLRRILARATYAAAWVVVGLVIASVLLDRSGWLSDSIRGRVTRALPDLEVEIGSARVLWFRPGIVLEQVHLSSGDGFLDFDTIEVRLSPAMGWVGIVSEIEIHGGQARITDELTRAIQFAIEHRGGLQRPLSDLENAPSSAIPTVTLTDFRVDVVFPGEAAVPIGRIDLKLEGRGSQKRLSGRLLPDLAGSTPDAAVHISGSLEGDRLNARASATQLPIDLDRLPRLLMPTSPVLSGGSALLSLAFEGGIDFKAELRPHFEGRLELAQGEVELSVSSAPIRDLKARIDLFWSPEKDDGLWSKQAWRGLAKLDANWDGSELVVHSRLGQSAGEDALQAWLWIPRLPLSADRRASLSLGRVADDLLGACGLTGSASVCMGFRIPSLRPDRETSFGPRVLVDIRPLEDAGFRFDGYRGADNQRRGIPLPASDLKGQVVIAHASGHERPARVGLVQLSGNLPSGQAFFEGTVGSPPPDAGPDARAEYELELWIPSLAVDADLEQALAGMPATSSIFEEYGPDGAGEISTRWRLRSDRSTRGMTAWGQIDFRSETLRWKPLPIPLREVTGRVSLRWGDRSIDLLDRGPRYVWRPFGILVEAEGHSSNGASMKVEIGFRNEAPDVSVMNVAQIPVSGTHRHWVSVEGMPLRGADFDALIGAHPIIGEVSEQLGLEGRVDVSYSGITPGTAAPYRFDIDVTPAAVQITPISFPLTARDVRGRILFTGVRPFTSDPKASTALATSLRGALSATTEQGYSATGIPHFKSGEPVRVTVQCAGVEPSNEDLIEAFKTAVGVETEDTTGLATGPGNGSPAAVLGGRVDGVVELLIPTTDDEPPSVTARVELRNNSLSAGRFQLDDMTGKAMFEGSVLRGDSIRARLADSAVELVDFRLVPAANIDALDAPDRMLSEPQFLESAKGLVVQCGLRARDFELSEENLSLFLDTDTVDSLINKAQLRGRIDFEDTRIVLVPDSEGELKLGMHGSVVPHNATVRAALPIQISSGQVEIDELRIESGRTRARAHITDLFGRIAGRQIERVAMLLTLMESHLSLEDLTGSLEGGSIASLAGAGGAPALSVDLQEPHFFTAAIEIGSSGRVDANGLLRGLFETSISDKGKTSGWLRVSGRPDDVLGLRGTGAVELREAQLWSIPVIRALFGRLGFDGTAQFDRMETGLRLENGVLHMIGMDVRSPILHVVGEGTIDLDGRLHHDLEIKYTLINFLGPLKVLLYWIQNSILRVAIRGTMWRPEVVLRNGVRDFFLGDPEHKPSLPLPGFSLLPARF